MDSLDQEVLDRLGRDMGGEAAVTRIIKMYLGKLPGEIDGLQDSCVAGDMSRLGDEAHRLKSSTAMLGATRLAGLLAELESSAKAEDSGEASRWMKEIVDEAGRVEAAMEARTG